MPKTNKILLQLKGFKYDNTIDLKMKYLHIQHS